LINPNHFGHALFTKNLQELFVIATSLVNMGNYQIGLFRRQAEFQQTFPRRYIPLAGDPRSAEKEMEGTGVENPVAVCTTSNPI
jgi:hypothetical protein